VNRRFLLGYLGVTLFVLLALEVPLGIQNQRNERRDIEVKVEHDATTLASIAEDAIQSGTDAALRPVAQKVYHYAGATGARVVVVDRRGFARIDTSARVAGAEDFATASRPEIRAALRGGVAYGTRYSQTLHTRLLYVAVPIASGGVVHGAVRITYPTSTVDARIRHLWLLLGLVAVVVLAGAALIGFFTARFVTRPLRQLEQAAAEVGDGRLEARANAQDGPPEVRSLAAVFNETVATLERVLRSQQEFVADASHELRTPLTALRLRLENGDLDGGLHEVERLSEMVDGLLALARADAAPTPAVSADAAAVVRERVAMWLPLAEERGIALVADTTGSTAARATPERLAQVLDNLVANAFDAAPHGTTVTVSAVRTPTGVELHVRDEGPGLSPDQRARAFDRFWRAGTAVGGSGLGLAIVRRLVEADGGEVELLESPDGGVDAVVRLRGA
jgi:signal transduction histidine kinase